MTPENVLHSASGQANLSGGDGLASEILDELAAVVAVLDPGGRVVGLNRPGEELSPKEHPLGKVFWEVFSEEPEAARIEARFLAARGAGAPQHFETRLNGAIGDQRTLRWTMRPSSLQGRLQGHVICNGVEVVPPPLDDCLRSHCFLMTNVLENMPVVVFRIDENGIRTDCVGKGLERVGTRDGEPIGTSALDHEQQLEPVRRAMAGETVLYKTHGTVQGNPWSYLNCLTFDEARGRGAIGFAIDTTDARQWNVELIEKTRLLEHVLTCISDGVVVGDNDGKFLLYNPAAQRLTGLGPADKPPEAWPEHYGTFRSDRVTRFAPEELPLVQAIQGTAVEDVEMFVRNPAQPAGRLLSVSGAPLEDERGNLTGGVIALRDITEREQAAQALQRSDERARALLDVIPDLLFRVNTAGRILDFKAGSEAPLLIPREKVIGSNVSQLPMPKATRRKSLESIRAAVREGTLQEFDYELELDAEVRAFESRVVRSGPDEAVCIVRDITVRRRAEARAKQLQSELIRVARLSTMGEIASGIAHELNQPLAAICNYAGACAASLGKVSGKGAGDLKRWSDEIGEQASRAGEIIRRLRALVNQQKPQSSAHDIVDLIHEVILLARSEVGNSGVRFRREWDGPLPPVLGDGIQIQQVVLNLIRNATEAMADLPEEEREVIIRVKEAERGLLEVAVADSGVGLPSEEVDRLFESFYSTKEDGMGIGLSISRFITRAHGGQLWATANSGRGATFHFTVPTAGR